MNLIIYVPIEKLIGPDNVCMVEYINKSDTYYGNIYQLAISDFEEWEMSAFYKTTSFNTFLPIKKTVNNTEIIINTPEEYILYLNKLWDSVKKHNVIDNVEITINYNGHIYIHEGHHRVSLYIANDRKYVRCKIISIDPDWEKFYTILRDDSIAMYKGHQMLYNPVHHPMFINWESIRPDRSKLIREVLQRFNILPNSNGLDIGCHIGYNAHMLALEGYNMTAIEYEDKYVYAFNVIGRYYGCGNKSIIVKDDITHWIQTIDSTKSNYSFAIVLSLLYHIYNKSPAQAKAVLQKLLKICKIIIMDDNPTYMPLSTIKELIADDTCQINTLYTGDDGRTIYTFALDKSNN